MSVSCECCVLSGRGLYGGPISRPEVSVRPCVCVCVTECDQVNNNTLHIKCVGSRGPCGVTGLPSGASPAGGQGNARQMWRVSGK